MNGKRLSRVQPVIMIYPAYTQIGPNVQAKLHWLKRLSTDQLLSCNLVTKPAREATKKVTVESKTDFHYKKTLTHYAGTDELKDED